MGYLSGMTEDQIKEDLKGTGADRKAEIIHFKKINHSIAAIIKDGDVVQCVIYDKFPFGFGTHYSKNSVIGINNKKSSVPLSNGWDIYMLEISINDITIENIEPWKGAWTEALVGFLISVFSVIIVTIIILTIKKGKKGRRISIIIAAAYTKPVRSYLIEPKWKELLSRHHSAL